MLCIAHITKSFNNICQILGTWIIVRDLNELDLLDEQGNLDEESFKKKTTIVRRFLERQNLMSHC